MLRFLIRQDLAQATRALHSGDYGRTVRMARKHLDCGAYALRIDAHRICGLGLFNAKRFEKAARMFRVVAQEAGGSDAWFNLATSATMGGDIATGAKAFQRSLERPDFVALSEPQVYYHYATALQSAGAYQEMLEPLARMRGFYGQMSVTDDHFLHARGVPFLSNTLGLVVDAYAGLSRQSEGRAWLDAFAREVDAEGSEQIATYRAHLV